MRILHTSDWHLGQHFMGYSRQAEHQALIDWLLTQVQTQAVDAVLIAGDIFDTGAPPSYARELYNQLIVRLHEKGVALLLLAGNHDSVSVLDESRDLLSHLGTQVVSSTGDDARHVVTLPLKNTDKTPGCIVCALPFIRPRDVQQSQAGQSAQDKQQALQNAIAATYQRVYAAALQKQAALQASTGQQLPIIATGHLTTVGASSNESVREIYVGALEAFPTNAFPPASYIALGHIHKPQTVGGLEHIRYSGSPLPLSFDETGKAKSVHLVSFSEGRLSAVETLEVPVTQPLAVIKGDLAAITAQLEQWRGVEQDPPVWLDIEITTEDYLHDIQRHIQALTEDLPVEVLLVRRSREQREKILLNAQRETLSELKVEEVFERRLALTEIDEMKRARLHELFAHTVHTLTAEDENA